MTDSMGNPTRRRGGRVGAALVPLAIVTLACRDGSGSSGADARMPATPPLCADERHVAAFDLFGTLVFTVGDEAGSTGTTRVPGDDLETHAMEVTGLGQICRPA